MRSPMIGDIDCDRDAPYQIIVLNKPEILTLYVIMWH